MNKSKPVFEHKTCGRCCGTGQYSYCQMHGTTCFKCGGSGFELTKRGKAAQSFLNDLRNVPASDFKVGDIVLIDGAGFSKTVFSRVTEIRTDANGYLVLQTNDGSVGGPPQSKWRKGFTADEKKLQVESALQYQSTLNKKGK